MEEMMNIKGFLNISPALEGCVIKVDNTGEIIWTRDPQKYYQNKCLFKLKHFHFSVISEPLPLEHNCTILLILGQGIQMYQGTFCH